MTLETTSSESSTTRLVTPGIRRRAGALAGRRISVPRMCAATAHAARGDGFHILLVGSDSRIALRLRQALRSAGYWVTTACTARASQAFLNAFVFDAVVVSETLADFGGTDLNLVAVSAGTVVVSVCSETGLDADRKRACAVGNAFAAAPQTILARLDARLRATGPLRQGDTAVVLGDLKFDLATLRLMRGETPLALTPHEARVLRMLAIHAYAAVPRVVLRPEQEGRGVDITVMRLRRRLEPQPAAPVFLRTVRGVGYMLTPTDISGSAQAPCETASGRLA